MLMRVRLLSSAYGINPEGHPKQTRSQKFTMGGCVWVWGRSPQPLETGGFGEKPAAAGGTGLWGRSPQYSKILHFFAKITSFQGYFDQKIILLKRGLEIGSANKIKLVA